MTRWLPSVTSLGLSKLLKGLLVLVVIKLALLVLLVGASIPPGPTQDDPPLPSLAGPRSVFSVSTAEAQTGDAADSGGTGNATAVDGSSMSLERQALLRKQEELDRREQALNALETEIDAKLVKLQELEASIQRLVTDARGVMDERLKHLIDVYANMKPKQAAVVLETLDEDIAVKILAGMSGRQAGEILTNVQADKAARLTEMLTRMEAPN